MSGKILGSGLHACPADALPGHLEFCEGFNLCQSEADIARDFSAQCALAAGHRTELPAAAMACPRDNTHHIHPSGFSSFYDFLLWQTRHCSLGGWDGLSGDVPPGAWHPVQAASVVRVAWALSAGMSGGFFPEERTTSSRMTAAANRMKPKDFFSGVPSSGNRRLP